MQQDPTKFCSSIVDTCSWTSSHRFAHHSSLWHLSNCSVHPDTVSVVLMWLLCKSTHIRYSMFNVFGTQLVTSTTVQGAKLGWERQSTSFLTNIARVSLLTFAFSWKQQWILCLWPHWAATVVWLHTTIKTFIFTFPATLSILTFAFDTWLSHAALQTLLYDMSVLFGISDIIWLFKRVDCKLLMRIFSELDAERCWWSLLHDDWLG